MLALLCLGCSSLRPMPSAATNEAGLVWQECPLANASFGEREIEACFGHSALMWDEQDEARYGKRAGLQGIQLVVGEDTYLADVNESIVPVERYTLYKNGAPLKTLWGEFTAYSPNISLQNLDGRVVWEFADHQRATIIYDGKDLRRLYGIDRAYKPYALSGKLIFVGEKDGRFFIVYDGVRVGPDFERIVIAYCCEAVLYSVRAGGGRYLFQGIRAGQPYLVEVAARVFDR